MQTKKNSLREYARKRAVTKSGEPAAKAKKKTSKKPIFVVQEHHARALHYDFRIEDHGVLVSWAVPKGPPLDSSEKRLAVQTEDHPLEYAQFAGVIPPGNYGAGTVKIWDHGIFSNLKNKPLEQCIEDGEIVIDLRGKKLKGHYALIKTKLPQKNAWIFIKMKK